MANLPEWWGRAGQRQNRRSKAQERRRAAQTGGKVQAGSGSSWRAPQDVKTPTHLEQLKYTDKLAYRLTVKEWKELRKDALDTGREPRLIIDFEGVGIRLVVTEESLAQMGEDT